MSCEKISIEGIRKCISVWKKHLRLVIEKDGNPTDLKWNKSLFALIFYFLTAFFKLQFLFVKQLIR